MKPSARIHAHDELELRTKLAARTEAQANEQARRLCAASSRSCRAGDADDWLDLEHAGRTYCFCAAHSLAAEVLAGGGFFFDGLSPDQIISRIAGVEAKHK